MNEGITRPLGLCCKPNCFYSGIEESQVDGTMAQIRQFNYSASRADLVLEVPGLYKGFSVSPTEKRICLCGYYFTAVWDLVTESQIFFSKGVSSAVSHFLSDEVVVLAGGEGPLRLINLNSGVEVIGPEIVGGTTSLSFAHEENLFLTTMVGEGGCFVGFFAVRKNQLSEMSGPVISTELPGMTAVFEREGNFLACVDTSARVYSFPQLELLNEFDRFGDSDSSVGQDWETSPDALAWSNPIFSHDSKYLFCESPEGTIFQFDLDFNQVWRSFRGHECGRRYLAISPDDKYLISQGGDGTFKVFDLTSPPE